jgi:CheY-like chemotaxis protein
MNDLHPPNEAQNNAKGCILAVEDDATSLVIMVSLLEELGYETLQAENGREALEVLEREAARIDAIVLDKAMPEMDGLEVVDALKDTPQMRHIPIVMVTGSKSADEVKEGIDAGVFYYLVKPFEDDVFESVVTSAMREANRRKALKSELHKHQASFGFIDKAEFTISTLDEAEDLACFIANCFPNPDTALAGLSSLLVNAIEHGNLEIGYEMKSELLRDRNWHDEVDTRQSRNAHKDQKVHVTLFQNDDETRVTIRDEGSGFTWQDYMEIDPSRALHTHGRGIAQANKISFEELIYNKKGNEVTAISKKGSGIVW